MAKVVTSFDGFAVNEATNYKLVLNPVGTSAPWTANHTLRERTENHPVLDYTTYGERRIPFHLYWLGAAADLPEFLANVGRYFAAARGERTLLAIHEDGTTYLTIQAAVENLTPIPGRNSVEGVFLTPDPFWQATALAINTTSPFTVAGDYDALPEITITGTTTTVRRRRIEVEDNTGRGLVNYIVQVPFDSSGVSASASTNYIVFYNGRSVPFYAHTLSNASTKLYVRVDVPANGTTEFDIYYGSSVSNSITNNQLNKAGMDLDDASFSNTNWMWDLPFTISTNPRGAAGAWVAARTGQTISGTSFGILDEAGAEVNFIIKPDGTLPSDVDGAVMTIGVEAASSNALTNLSRDDVSVTGTGHQIRVRYRIANQAGWSTATTHGSGAAETGAISVPAALQIMLSLQAIDATANATAEFKLAGGANLTLALDATKTPTVTVASAVTARFLDSALVNDTTGDQIVLDELFIDDVDLIVDCIAQTVRSEDDSPINTSGDGILPSNPATWFPLPVGEIQFTAPTNATVSLEWAKRYTV